MSGRAMPRYLIGGIPVPERERDVWRMLAESETTKSIALEMHLSPKTIEHHRAKLYRRLGIYDVAGITRAAIRNGIVKA